MLALTPESPEAHNNFANTCKRLGRLAEAERHWLRALELRETYPEPHSNLANLCSDLGAFDRAAYHARRAISLAPRFADAYLNLALVETARGNDGAALAAQLGEVAEIDRRRVRRGAGAAYVLQRLRRPAILLGDKPEQMQRVGVPRPVRQDGLAQRSGVLGAAGLQQALRLLQAVLHRVAGRPGRNRMVQVCGPGSGGGRGRRCALSRASS